MKIQDILAQLVAAMTKLRDLLKLQSLTLMSPTEIHTIDISQNLPPVAPLPTNQAHSMNPTPIALYNEAYAALGTHLTLDPNVPKEVGCMEAVSKLLRGIGVEGIPVAGIPGTASGLTFLENSPQFEERHETPLMGDIVMFATGTSTIGSQHGHVLVMGKEWLMSNDSDTGLWAAKYTLATALHYFSTVLGFPIRTFRLKGI